ncbi:hypothetical protein Tco_0155715 [Tanacetum coccineum]
MGLGLAPRSPGMRSEKVRRVLIDQLEVLEEITLSCHYGQVSRRDLRVRWIGITIHGKRSWKTLQGASGRNDTEGRDSIGRLGQYVVWLEYSCALSSMERGLACPEGLETSHGFGAICTHGGVISLRHQVYAQMEEITELQSADRRRQRAMSELLETDRGGGEEKWRASCELLIAIDSAAEIGQVYLTGTAGTRWGSCTAELPEEDGEMAPKEPQGKHEARTTSKNQQPTTTTNVTNTNHDMINQGDSAALPNVTNQGMALDSHSSGRVVRGFERCFVEMHLPGDFMKCKNLCISRHRGVVELTIGFERMRDCSFQLGIAGGKSIKIATVLCTDVVKYNQRFQELALLCVRMFPEEADKIEVLMDKKAKWGGGGFSVPCGKTAEKRGSLKTLHEAIRINKQQPNRGRTTGGRYTAGIRGTGNVTTINTRVAPDRAETYLFWSVESEGTSKRMFQLKYNKGNRGNQLDDRAPAMLAHRQRLYIGPDSSPWGASGPVCQKKSGSFGCALTTGQ